MLFDFCIYCLYDNTFWIQINKQINNLSLLFCPNVSRSGQRPRSFAFSPGHLFYFIFYFIHLLYIAQMQWYNIDKYNLDMLVHQDLEGREL